MFTQFNYISPTSLQSFEKLYALNVSTVQNLVNQNCTLFANVIDDTLAFSRNACLDRDFQSSVTAHKVFSSAICYNTLEAWKQTTASLTQVQKEAELIFITSYEYASDDSATKVVGQKELQNF